MNKIKSDSIALGLDYRKEIMKIILVLLLFLALGIVIYVLLKNIMLCLICILLGLVFSYLIINNIQVKKAYLLENRDQEFIAIITYFQTFIKNNVNVYISFRKCMNYSTLWMKEQLTELLSNIDKDKTVKPYLNFASKFQKNYVETIMISIYQMVDEGENGAHFVHFNDLFNQISSANYLEKINIKKKSIEGISVFPLIGAGMITILLTFGIIGIIGELINVV